MIKITSCVLDAPIERVRGGDIVVALRCTIESTEQVSDAMSKVTMTSVTGVGIAREMSDIPAAYENAVKDAQEKAAKILGLQLGGVDPVAHEKVVEAMAIAAENEIKATMEDRKEKGSISQEQFDQLAGPTDDTKQRELTLLCETLGIPKIDAQAKDWPLLTTISAIFALRKRAKRLEAQNVH